LEHLRAGPAAHRRRRFRQQPPPRLGEPVSTLTDVRVSIPG
jgi:hypothetical protein